MSDEAATLERDPTYPLFHNPYHYLSKTLENLVEAEEVDT
jgi:hypothetical protein